MRINIKVKFKNDPDIINDFINVPTSCTTQEIEQAVSRYVHRQYTRVEAHYHNIEITSR